MADHFQHKDEHIDGGMMKLEVNLDDISAEWLGYLMDKLFDTGVNEAYYIPIYMKKNRPGILLHVLCHSKKLEKVKEVIFLETTTLGLRYFPIHTHRLERTFSVVETPWGTVNVKKGYYSGVMTQASPEYEDCKKIAEREKIPLKVVFQEVWGKIHSKS
ncbi:LarC family nickel insertion protein [Bacillus sp. T33-2]|uniref:LarC family nickel insertion protein n=1 Tax=Bacillus sp. T33-2 TaxID=2054168 RepID=UPI00215575A0|nr:LarC family nickel insertion protein [Bacillus sp. T33-2]